jgi:ketosteroid isomerase-like protein
MPRGPNVPVTIVAVLASLNWLHARTVRWSIRRNLARLWVGDPEPLLANYADDVRFTFPGHSSWAGEFRGKEEVARWLGRFVRVGLRFAVHEILVVGPPWDATLCLWFTDRLTDPNGGVVYENRGTIMAKLAWGKIVSYEVNEDTQKVAALDHYLEAHGVRAAPAGE